MQTADLKNSIVIFCDGACKNNPGPGGWGAIIVYQASRVLELGGAENPSTNNRMELKGMIAALRHCLQEKGPLVFFSDSSYVLNAVTKDLYTWERSGWRTSSGSTVANLELWQEMLELILERRKIGPVSWQKVRGHQGIPGNERADLIAVSHAIAAPINLYDGPYSSYPIDVYQLEGSAPAPKNGGHWYLSYVDGVLERHTTWDQCKRRVEGRPAKYRKITSVAMEQETLKSWNLP